MAAKRLSGSTVSSNTLKKWLLSGHTNAASDREQAILSEFEGLTWVRKDVDSNVTGNTNPQYPYYAGLQGPEIKSWQVPLDGTTIHG